MSLGAVHLKRSCKLLATGDFVLSALLIALREGVEASLVVGIILVYLSRTGRGRLTRFVWYGVAAAAALSLGVAVALERWRISEDGFEGLMLLIAAVFVILMVLREGAELALILRAVELSSEGLQTWIGTIVGIAAAVAVGLFFFKGTLRIPLHRFFAATSVILMLVAFQLALTGLHELSEARWLPSSKAEMAILGPIVRNELFFFVFIL